MLWLSVFWMLLLLSRLESFGVLTVRLRSNSCLSVASLKGFGLQWHNYLPIQAVKSVCLWYTAVGSGKSKLLNATLLWDEHYLNSVFSTGFTWNIGEMLSNLENLCKLLCLLFNIMHFEYYFFRTALSIWMLSRGAGHDPPQSLVKGGWYEL